MTRLGLYLAILLLNGWRACSFSSIGLGSTSRRRIHTCRHRTSLLSSIEDNPSLPSNGQEMLEKPSFWKPRNDSRRWKKRVHLRDLEVGQKLLGYVVQDLLDGKTGPKLFLECGIGRTNSKGEWSIVHGMMRLERSKKSVAVKRAARLRKKDEIEVFVSRIQQECGRVEVVQTVDEVEMHRNLPKKVSVSSLREGDEVQGKIVKLHSYGAIVDVGANRLGLLHIQRVADLYGKYINKENGMAEAGLERGAKVRLSILSNEKRRLFLDFTPDVKNAAAQEKEEKATKSESLASSNSDNDANAPESQLKQTPHVDIDGLQSEKIDLKTLDQRAEEFDEEEDDEEEYDEDKDIEDALGLGFY